MRLLGDMRSYNYVVIPTHDFEHVDYKIRAIDFDQQCYEGKLKVYQPQFFKENFAMVDIVMNRLEPNSIEQYKKEERSVLAKRIINSRSRYEHLIKCMCRDHLSSQENVDELKEHLYNFTLDLHFRRSHSMGEVLKTALEFVKRNYENVNMKRLLKG